MARFSHERTAAHPARRTVYIAWLSAAAIGLSLQLAPAGAQSAGTLYLHGTGDADNPAILFLNTSAPAAGGAKYKDSPAISFQAGNAWREIGRWTSAAGVTVTADFASLDIWAGVKATDDDKAAYDLQAVISQNGADIASGQTLCVSGLSQAAASAKRVSVSLSSLAHAANGPITLKLSNRVGTTPAGVRCANGKQTPAAASGLRVYFDSADRPSAINAASPPPPVNSAPVVSAGSNQTIALPAAATLAGSVKDDGLPAGATVTSTWTMTSGPATVIFANAANLSTTATFSKPGPYVLRLTATDTEKSAYAEVTITVNPASPTNQPPQVNAGLDQTITLPSTASLSGSVSDDGLPAGGSLTSLWSQVSGPGVVAFANAASASTTATFPGAGKFVLRLTAGDSALSTSDDVEITVNPATATNHPPAFTSSPATSAKHQIAYSYQATASDPDGDPLTFSLGPAPAGMTIGASGLVQWTPTGNQIGKQPVAIVVTDSKNASTTQSFEITVVDATAPVVTLSMPAEALPGTAVIATALANDNVGVMSVTFEVNGGDAQDDTSAPFQRTIAVPGTALAGTEFHVHATARDAAGNVGEADRTFKVASTPDTQPPTLTLNVPTEAAAGTIVRLTAAATDATGVKSVTFKRGATVLATDTEAPFEATYTVPADAPVSSSIDFTARALDFADNFADASGSLVVAATPDRTPPTVQLTAPAQIEEGGALTLSAAANDNVGVASVVFFVNGVPVGTSSAAPYAALFRLPASVKGGDSLHLEARAVDFAGLEAKSTQDTQVLAAPNRAPIASAGGPYAGQAGDQIQLSAAASSDPDAGDALTFDWDFGDGTRGSGVAPRHAYASAGSFTVTVTVNDSRDGTSSAQASVAIAGATDRTAPRVTLNGPSSVLPGSQVTVTAQASDDQAVASVTFDVNAADPTTTSTAPYQRTIAVPAVASPGDRLTVRATARDAAGNQASTELTLTISGVPDTENPTVTLNAPPQAAAGSTLHLSAAAIDNVGVETVLFTVNGQTIATLKAPPFEANYPIPSDAPANASLGITVRASDFNGNSADASGVVSITAVSAADTTPPTIALTAPLQVFAGKTLTLSATAADNVGVAGVTFFIDGVNVSTSTTAPYTFTLPLGSAYAAGAVLHLSARAIDFAGLQATDLKQTLVVSSASAGGQGILTGETYDDSTGLPLAGVTATLTSADADGMSSPQTTTTDARGRWVLHAAEGRVVVSLTKPGWTRVDRKASIVADQALELVDARLTAVSTGEGRQITPVLGGTLETSTSALVIPPGALQEVTDVRLTNISQQGLEGILPRGWSPLAVADVAPHGVSFGGGGALSISTAIDVPAGTHVVVGTWDEELGLWRAVEDLTISSGSRTLETTVPSAGQYALLIPDVLPNPPPPAIAGEEIKGIADAPLSANVVTVIDPQPKILFYNPGVRSDVRGTITAPASPASSGTLAEARITESYSFLNGTMLNPEPFAEDFFFFQIGVPTAGVTAGFTVTPSQTFDPFALQSGVINVELRAPADTDVVPTIGANGGTATSATGERLIVPQGALTESLPLAIRGLTPDTLGIALPAGLTLAGSAQVDFSGSLGKPATLSVVRPSSIADASRLLLVRLQAVGGETRMVLVGRATIAADRIVSDTSLDGTPDAFEGVRAAGRYLFVQTATAIGFAKGSVLAAGGGAFAGALVSPAGLPIVALSATSGVYVAASATGAITLTALDLQTSDTATGTSTIPNAGGVVALNLQITASVPRVTAITPADGATSIPLASPIVVRFSKPIVPASVNATTLTLAAADGSAVPGAIAFSSNNTVATLRPSSALASKAAFTVSLTDAIVDLSGRHLASAVSAHFTSLDTSPPPAPPAGSVQASIPAQGFTTVTATQGTAGVHDTVVVINLTRNTTTPVLVDPNGGFSVRLAATLTERLQIVITNQNGTQTVVPIGAFRQTNADGSVSAAVSATGGMIEGPAGTAVEVPQGAFPDGAVITLKTIAEAQFPVQLDAPAKQILAFSSGVQLDLGGKTPEKYLNVFVPAAAADKASDQWLVSRVRDNNGVPVLDIVDTAKLISGRIRTSSPPCPGVTGEGVYGVYKSSQPVGVSYAHMSSSGYGGLQMNATMLLATGAALPLPWFVLEPVTAGPICYPVLTGRVTVTANAQTVTIPADQLTQADREIVVRNTTRNTEMHFPRNVLEFVFEVAGGPSDGYTVVVRDSNGSDTAITSIDVIDAGAGTVKVRLDADRIPVSVAAVTITNLTTKATIAFPQTQVALKLSVAGGAGDTYQVTAINAAGQPRQVAIAPVLSPTGPGNMIARALTGTIDPTRAEIDAYNAQHPDAPIVGAGRTRVLLKNLTQNTNVEIPSATIANGGFTYNFDGGLTDRYSVEVQYEDGKKASIDIPTFRITVQNRATGREIKTITLPAPPRDEPLNLGVISDDNQRPTLVAGPARLTNFDNAGGLLTFKFSEAMDAASLKAGIIVERVRNGQRIRVAGEFRVSQGNTVVTFVPKFALGVGEEYSITFVGDDALGGSLVPGGTPVTDASGNALSTTRFRVTTFKPRTVGNYEAGADSTGDPIEFKDVEIRRKTVNNKPQTYLVATADSRLGYRLATFDVTDPAKPVQLKTAAGGSGKKRLILLPDIGTPEHPAMPLRQPSVVCDAGITKPTVASPFKGDLAVTTSWNTYYSYLTFYDVTNPELPCVLASKLLTASPDALTTFSQKGTVHALGYARGVATIQHAQGYAAYTAVGEVGLFAADIGQDIPEYGPDDRVKEASYPGDYYDVVNVSNRLLAANRGDSRLDLFDPNLTLLGSIELPLPPRRIVTVSGYGVDRNEDGLLTPDEQFDLALVSVDDPATGAGRIEIVDITNDADLRVVGEITMPGNTRDLAVDPERRRIFAVGTGQSATGTGTDALFMIDLSNPFNSGAPDYDGDGLDDRILWQHTYATSLNGIRLDANRGLLYAATGKGIDLWAMYDSCCDLAVDLTARAPHRQSGDRAALLAKEKKALQQEISTGLQNASTTCNTPLPSIAILEQGSGACLWKSDPLKACNDSYQPGLSDHDYEVFFPAGVSPSTQSCTVAELSKRFIEPDTGNPKEIVLDDGSTITFEDVTFFPFRREDFESGKLNVLPPQSSGGDATGDLGLGRQQLLLLWLLGGEYVQVPAVAPGRSLDDILQTFTSLYGIQRLEGYEWASLQSFNLAKSKARLRLKGASDPQSALHAIYVKQLHDAAKAGIRAAFARLVADNTGNSLAARVTRQSYVTNACLGVNEAVTNPNRWFEKPCTSFEEYAASAIARTLRGPVPLPIFTLAEVFKIHRFYRVKADIDHIISEADADAFVASVWQFLEQSKAITQPIYQQQIGTAPDAAQRTANLSTAEAKRDAALKTAKLALPAHVANRGFRAADQVALAMYRADTAGSGQLVKSMRLDLAGGDDRILAFERNADGTLKLDDGGQALPVFELGPVDLTTDLRTPHGVSFTIDLPERKVAEAVRENNLGGFFYYALDVQNPAIPATPATPYLPFSDPSVLDPSPECDNVPALSIRQQILTAEGQHIDEAELGLGDTVTIELVVSNRSGEALHEVKVCSNITNQCYDAGTLAVGETKTISVPYTVPSTGLYIDGAPSAYSTEAGITSGPSTRISANCESYSVIPLAKNPNPDVSEAMIGGSALRYYKVVSRRTGAPKPNATIDFELTGFFGPAESTKHFTLKTDAEGRIFDPSNPAPPDAIPGLPIAATRDMVIGSNYFGTIRSVDGVQTACSQPVAFEFKPADREFSRSYAQGVSIKGTAGIYLSAEVGAEAGIEIEKEETYRSGVKALNLTTTEQLSGKLGKEFGFDIGASVGIAKFEAGAEVGVSSTRLTGWSTKHSFDYPLDQPKNCAIAAIMLERLLGFNPLLVKLLDLARTDPCSDPTPYLKSTGRTFGREAEATANVSISASIPYSKSEPKPGDKNFKLSFGADGSSGFSVEVGYKTGYDIANRGLTDPASSTEEYKLKGGLNFKAGLEADFQADPPKNEDEEDKTEDKTTVETVKRSLKTSVSEDLAETYSVSFSNDFTKPRPADGYPNSVDISYSPPKGFGWKRTVLGQDTNLIGGVGRSLTYTIDDPADVKKVVDSLANLDAIRKANVGSGVLSQITLAPTVLNDELAKFRGLLRDINATYTISESKGQGNELPVDVKGKLGPFKLGGGIALKADHSVSYTIEKGIVVNGASYALEKYTKDEFVPDHDLGLLDAVTATWNALADSFKAEFSDVAKPVPNSGTTQLKSNFTATLNIDGTKEPAPFDAGLFSWRFRPIDGPVQDAHYLPSDTAGPRGNPHYGIGSFHQFSPAGYQLAVPTALVIDYTDAELEGIDESSLQIYGWNQTAEDWDLVGGTVNLAANTVTAPVSTFRLYTLGPAMPARDISLSAHDDGPTGVGDSATQRFTVTSGPLVMNNGQPVPDGTVYTVRTLVPGASTVTPYGTILTPDEDGARNEVQVSSHNGVIQFEVEYPAPNGAYIPGRLVAYSTKGTAFGQTVAVKQ